MDYRALFFKIRMVDHLHRKRCEDIMNSVDLFFGQLPILAVLSKQGPSSQKEVASQLHVSAPSMANSVKRMEKKGLLTCEVKEEDRRLHVLKLTSKGCEAKDFCFAHFQELDKKICANISEEDLVVFQKVLDTMMENLKEEGEEDV